MSLHVSNIYLAVQFSCSVVSDSLWPHEPQHARPPCPSPTPGIHSNSRPSISDVIQPSHPLSSPSPTASKPSQHQSIFHWVSSSNEVAKVSALASFLPKNTQGWSPLEWTGWISLQSKDSKESSPTPQFKSINSSVLSFLHSPTLTSIHDHWKTIALTRWTFVGKVMSLLLNMLSRLVIAFLPRSKHLLISWLLI